MFLTDTNDIKNVIAFPKNKKAECLLSQAPNEVSEAQLDEIGIEIKNED